MRLILLVVTAVLFVSHANASEYLKKVESEVYKTEQSKESIFKQAETCIIQHVHNDAVQLAGNLSTSLQNKTVNYIQGGDVIRHKDIEGGVIYANSRADFKSHMVALSVQSTISLMVKEGRFKVRHSDILYMQKSTGFLANKGYKKWKVNHHFTKKALETINGITSKLVDCIQNPPKEEDW